MVKPNHRILVSGFTFRHHTKYGGYDKVGMNPQVSYINDENMLFARFFSLLKYRRICLIFLDIYTRFLFMIKYDILHYAYIEDQFYFPMFFKGKKILIGTVHLDPVAVEKSRSLKQNKNYLKFIHCFDLIIALSSEMAKTFNERYGVKAIFVPHGFSPPAFSKMNYADEHNTSINKEKINIFFSGSHYRDYDTFLYVLQNINNRDVHFHIVGQQFAIEWKQKLGIYDNVSIYNRLSDDEYFSLLDDCDYNFLPLTFATANNALLEAQALGVASILPNIEGILDYAAPGPFNVFYSQKEQALEIYNNLKKSGHNNNIIDHADKFNWNNVYNKLNEVYDSLLPED